MHVNDSIAACFNFLKKLFTKKQLFLSLYGTIIIFGFIPAVYAEDILKGTPQTQSGSTVYRAIVEPNQSYSSVFGVQGDNTDSYSYGQVIINEGIVSGTVYGSRATNRENYVHASYNVVDITDSNIGTVYGGYAYGGTNNSSVQSNKVTINGGSITGYVYGGNSDGATISVTGNKVVISNAQIGKTVYGGCAFNTESWLSMLRNEVVIDNSTVKVSVYGGYASGSSTASNNNSVIIKNNAEIKGSVYGGYALSNNSDAKNNSVIIEGGTVNGHIYGGIGRNASNNVIVVKGGNLSNADLFGYSDGRKSHYGNTLELWAADIQAKSVRNFENYFFSIPEGIANQENKYMLKVDEPVNLSGTTVGIAVQNGTELHVNDKINLIDKIEGTPTLVSLEEKTLKGGTLFTHYDFYLSYENNSLVAIASSEGRPSKPLSSLPVEPAGQAYSEAKALTEGQVASVSLLAKGSDLVISKALSDAKTAAHTASANGQTLATFLTFDFGKTDYFTDSHIRINDSDIIAGVAKEFSGLKSENLVGLYFESGNGNYSTFNSFENGSVCGNGNAKYYGGGLFFQMDPSEETGFYLQALGRIGSTNNNWSTDDFFREKVSYTTDHLYYGAAAGVGYKDKTAKKVSFDVSGKFMWAHQNGDNVNISGEKIQFENINSLKVRIGLKVAYDGFNVVKPFVGIVLEKEFNAVAKAQVNKLRIDDANLKGNSAILELGMNCKPENNANWQLNFEAIGYLGIRRGLRGSAFFIWSF